MLFYNIHFNIVLVTFETREQIIHCWFMYQVGGNGLLYIDQVTTTAQ